jgi:hypothetical protein
MIFDEDNYTVTFRIEDPLHDVETLDVRTDTRSHQQLVVALETLEDMPNVEGVEHALRFIRSYLNNRGGRN